MWDSETRLGVLAFTSTLILLSACASEDARLLAEEAFYLLEDDPFSHEIRNKAMEDLALAYELNPDEPWVAVARSRLALELGYRRGSRFSKGNFNPKPLEAALFFAQEGVRLGPGESVAHSQLARVQIVHGQYRNAWDTLNSAYANDPDDFYPWYFRSVISTEMRERERAEQYIAEAEKRIVRPLHEGFVLGQRQNIVLAMGSEQEKEESYLVNIEHDPDDAYAYGNYGSFLLRRERYEEAESMLEKALSIRRYRAAEEDLEKARAGVGQD